MGDQALLEEVDNWWHLSRAHFALDLPVSVLLPDHHDVNYLVLQYASKNNVLKTLCTVIMAQIQHFRGNKST